MPPGARLIGIDVGTKTLGLALSDVTRTIASGLVTLRRSRFAADAERLLQLAAEHRIGGFVVGLPLNLDGSTGPRAQATRAFARNLASSRRCPSCCGTSGCRPWRPSARCWRPTPRASAGPR